MRILKIATFFLFLFQQIGVCQNLSDAAEHHLDWQKVSAFSADEMPLDNLNGAFFGSHNGVFIFAGGSSFQFGDSLQKADFKWNEKVFVFEKSVNGNFEKIPTTFTLPFGATTFGASISTENGLVCVGGLSPDGERKKSFLIKWNAELQTIEFDTLPDLPEANAFISGGFLGTKIYISGGLKSKFKESLEKVFYTIDLSKNRAEQQWETVEISENLNRRLPNFCSQSNGLDNCLYVFGGLKISSNLALESSNDVFQFNPKTKLWKELNPIPAKSKIRNKIAPGTAIAIGSTDVLYFDPASRKSFLYHTITDNWEVVGDFPEELNPLYFFKSGNAVFAFSKNNKNAQLELHQLSFPLENQSFGLLNILVLVFYFGLLIFLGFYFSKKQKNADDYFKGGKKIPWWAAGLSLYGTGLSAISFMAVPAKTYATDWAYFMTKLPQFLIPIIVCWLFIPFFRKLDITTAYEYLERRFNLATRLIGSFSFIVFQLGRIGIVLYLPAIAINVATGMDIVLCIVLMGVISLIYTIMGGIEAVIWADVLQVIILLGGIILCLALISFSLEGGMKEIIEVGKQNEKFEILNMALDFTQPTFWVVVMSGFFSQLIVYSTDQSMVQRYLTTKDVRGAKRSIWTSTLVSLSMGWVFFFVGTALFAFYKAHPAELMPALASTDAIFPWYIFSQLPDGVNGLLIAGIFAAAMSSLSSSMNSAATAYTVDFHHLFNWKGSVLNIGRISTLVIGIAGISFALLFATMDVKSIWDEFIKIIGLLTGGLGGVFLLGIISTRANGIGALVGLFGSGIIQLLVANHQPVHFMLFTATGFVSCLLIGYFVSLFFPNHSKPLAGLTIFTVATKKA